MTKEEMQEKIMNIRGGNKTLQDHSLRCKIDIERFDELAGKYEYSAGMNREEAEKRAREELESAMH